MRRIFIGSERISSIVVAMENDPIREWQRLTRVYGEMSDEELLDLAAGFSDLTEVAQPILRDEMKKRGLGEPSETISHSPSKTEPGPAVIGFESERGPMFGGWHESIAEQDDHEVHADSSEDEEHDQHEYTWKTMLCECDTREQVLQIIEVLRQGGIEAWASGPSSYFGSQTTRIMVAADQLEEAKRIIASPIPEDVVEESRVKVEDFVPPTCPKCGAEDPLLESVDPTNTWRCDYCGATWSDSAAFDSAQAERR